MSKSKLQVVKTQLMQCLDLAKEYPDLHKKVSKLLLDVHDSMNGTSKVSKALSLKKEIYVLTLRQKEIKKYLKGSFRSHFSSQKLSDLQREKELNKDYIKKLEKIRKETKKKDAQATQRRYLKLQKELKTRTEQPS